MKISTLQVVFPKIDILAKPEFYESLKKKKEIHVENELHAASRHIGENRFEVLLNLKLTDKTDYFKLDVACVGVFAITGNVDKQVINQVLNVNCCATLFPYLREKVTYLTAAVGLPAVYLDSYNFAQRYQQIKQQEQAKHN